MPETGSLDLRRSGTRAARLLAPEADRPPDDAGVLPGLLTSLMRGIGIPDGTGAVGYAPGDIAALVEGTLKQQRLLASCP